MGSVYGFYQSWVSHVGNIRYDHATETELVVLLLVRYFLGDLFFRPTPDGSRQVVYQAGKTIALCKFTELMQWKHWS